MLLYYREARDGQILEEGITEAGSMASFTAAGTAYSNYGVPSIPFYMYYSMFGFQRIGDMVWAFADSRGKGFLMGGTAGRTTMLGEGLQHQDGHSLVLSSTVPTCLTYDPAYVFELAIVLQDGIRRMYQNGEDVFYYITMYNEDYEMPAMPDAAVEGVLKGLYKFRASESGPAQAQLFGSGPILNERPPRPDHPRRKVQHSHRRLERPQLHRSPPRSARRRALESPPPLHHPSASPTSSPLSKAHLVPSSPPATT